MLTPSELRQRYPRLARSLPALAFFGGFIFDALTLGRQIIPIDFVILTGYYLICAAILLVIGREIEHRWEGYQVVALQFFFGGLFSAVVILYFLSSSEIGGFTLVAGLTVLLIANEFVEHRYGRLTLSWTLFTICGIMFFNFALPHLFRSIQPRWFYASIGVALGTTLLLRALSKKKASVLPSFALAAVLLVLYVANILPPVPLVKKDLFIAHRIEKTAGRYTAEIEPPPRRMFWLRSSPLFHRTDSEAVYCFSSIFIPRGLETSVRHRWQILDETTGEWTTTDVMQFTIRGGRREGYRGFSSKANAGPGRWRVRAESPEGKTIGIIAFSITETTSLSNVTLRRVTL